MAYTTYNCDTMTGGAARSLDVLSVGDLTNGDRAVVMMTAKSYFFKYNSTGTAAEQVATAPRVVRPDDYSSAGNWEEHVAEDASSSSVVVQIVSTAVTSVVSGSTLMPIDNTVPQSTEGFEVITKAITPTSESNMLLITADVESSYNNTGNRTCGIALFQDTTAGALAARTFYSYSGGAYNAGATLHHVMTAAVASATTFKIRVGPSSSATLYVNSLPTAATQVFNGVSATRLTIVEYTP